MTERDTLPQSGRAEISCSTKVIRPYERAAFEYHVQNMLDVFEGKKLEKATAANFPVFRTAITEMLINGNAVLVEELANAGLDPAWVKTKAHCIKVGYCQKRPL